MCKPLSQGGQRCAAHTRKDLKKALKAHASKRTQVTFEAVQKTRAEFASTPTGAAELSQELKALTPGSPEATDLEIALHRGKALRERNAAMATAQIRLGPTNERLRMASDPRTSTMMLHRLYNDPAAQVRLAALRHPKATQAMLTHASTSDDALARIAVAEHPKSNPLLRKQLRRDPSPLVREALARTAPPEEIAGMWQEDTDPQVREALAGRMFPHGAATSPATPSTPTGSPWAVHKLAVPGRGYQRIDFVA